MPNNDSANRLEKLYLEIPVKKLEGGSPRRATLREAVQSIAEIHEQNPGIPVHSVLDMDGTIAPGKPDINQWEFFVTSVVSIWCGDNEGGIGQCSKTEKQFIERHFTEIYQQFQAPFLDWAYRMRDVDLAKYYPNEARVSQDIKEILEWSANLYDFMRTNYFKGWYQEFISFLERTPVVRNYLYSKYEKQMRDDDQKVTYIDNQHLAEFLTEQHIRNVIWHIATYKLRMKLLEAHFAQQEQAQTQATVQDLVTQQMLEDRYTIGRKHFNSMSSEQQQKYREAIQRLVKISQKSGSKVIIDSFGVPELVESYLLAALEVEELPKNIIILGPSMKDMLDFINIFDSFWPQYSQGVDWDAPVLPNSTLDNLAKKLDNMSAIFSPTSFPVATSKAVAMHAKLIELGLINTDKNGNLRVRGILTGLGDSSTYDVFLWYILGLNASIVARTSIINSNQKETSFLITNKGNFFV